MPLFFIISLITLITFHMPLLFHYFSAIMPYFIIPFSILLIFIAIIFLFRLTLLRRTIHCWCHYCLLFSLATRYFPPLIYYARLFRFRFAIFFPDAILHVFQDYFTAIVAIVMLLIFFSLIYMSLSLDVYWCHDIIILLIDCLIIFTCSFSPCCYLLPPYVWYFADVIFIFFAIFATAAMLFFFFFAAAIILIITFSWCRHYFAARDTRRRFDAVAFALFVAIYIMLSPLLSLMFSRYHIFAACSLLDTPSLMLLIFAMLMFIAAICCLPDAIWYLMRPLLICRYVLDMMLLMFVDAHATTLTRDMPLLRHHILHYVCLRRRLHAHGALYSPCSLIRYLLLILRCWCCSRDYFNAMPWYVSLDAIFWCAARYSISFVTLLRALARLFYLLRPLFFAYYYCRHAIIFAWCHFRYFVISFRLFRCFCLLRAYYSGAHMLFSRHILLMPYAICSFGAAMPTAMRLCSLDLIIDLLRTRRSFFAISLMFYTCWYYAAMLLWCWCRVLTPYAPYCCLLWRPPALLFSRHTPPYARAYFSLFIIYYCRYFSIRVFPRHAFAWYFYVAILLLFAWYAMLCYADALISRCYDVLFPYACLVCYALSLFLLATRASDVAHAMPYFDATRRLLFFTMR